MLVLVPVNAPCGPMHDRVGRMNARACIANARAGQLHAALPHHHHNN